MTNKGEDKDQDQDQKPKMADDKDSLPLSLHNTIRTLNSKASNLSVEWTNWKTRFTIFMRASGLEGQDDARKVALVLHHMGADCLDIFTSFGSSIDDIKYDALIEKFDNHFLPKKNLAMERHKFFIRKQASNETIDEYITSLKNLSLTCEFGNLRDSLIKDIFVCGLSPDMVKIKEKLLGAGDIKLEKAIEAAKAIAFAQSNVVELQGQGHSHDNECVGVVSRKPNNICGKCGQIHKYRCPALGATCYKCNNKNHFANMCFYKDNNKQAHKTLQQQRQNKKYVRNIQAEEGELEEQRDLFVGTVQQQKQQLYTACEDDLFIGTVQQQQQVRQDVKDEWIININVKNEIINC